jgi:hypothetical protein
MSDQIPSIQAILRDDDIRLLNPVYARRAGTRAGNHFRLAQ